MADTSITREEKYLEYLTGNHKGNVPKPVTRRERYLYELCLKGMGGEISPEEIKNAVNEYLEKNPVKPGATTEQAQQIEQNKTDIASLKVETGSLKEDLSNKITKFYASSQGETHLADSDNGKIMDMMVYGKSEQKQYSGKNLLNATLQTTAQNGVTCTANGDGTYTLNGTATVNSYFKIGMTLFKNTKKYKMLGCPTNGGSNTYYLGYDKKPWYIDIGTGQSFTFNGDTEEQISLTIGVKSGITCNNILFKPMIVDASLYPDTTYDDFEPYTGGIPSPNPDYPQEIKSVVNPTMKVCGKNLLKATLQTTTVNGVTCTNNGDGTYTLNGTATATGIFVLHSNIDFTGQMRLCGGTSLVSLQYSNSSNFAYEDKGAGIIIEHFDSVTYPNASFNILIKTDNVYNNALVKPMLTTDFTATYDDFEPYHGQTVTLPYTLNAIPVSSGGNVTIDGQQYIADYVDAERGKLVKMVDDIEAKNYIWDLYPGEINMPRRFGMNDTIRFNMPADIRIMSSHFKQIATNTRTDLSTWFQTYYIAITDMNEKWKNSEALIQWFSENNVHFYLPLKTPTEIDLTPEEVRTFKALVTYYPTTNISINSEQLDGYTVFNYPISMENGWNYVKQQIGDTRDYIYDMDARTQDTGLQAAEAYVNSEYAVALTELEV